MIEDIELHIKSCPHCLRFKTQPEKAELNPIIATRPLELVHIHYLTVEAPENSKSDKDINVLVITDHFTRYAQAHITSSQKAPVVAKTLWEHFFVHYGFPEKILSDQGRNFESALVSKLCELTQIKKLEPHHTDQKEMALVRDSIEHSFPCWVPFLKITKTNGPNILVPSHMRIIALGQMQQDSVPIIYFMVDNHCYQLTLNLVFSPLNCQKPLHTNMYKN